MIKKIIIKTQNKLQDKAERKKKKDHLCADETQFVPKIWTDAEVMLPAQKHCKSAEMRLAEQCYTVRLGNLFIAFPHEKKWIQLITSRDEDK